MRVSLDIHAKNPHSRPSSREASISPFVAHFCRYLLLLLLFSTGGCVGVIPGPSLLGIAKVFFACIPEGTHVDTPNGSRPIEDIQAGDQVIGFSGKPVNVIQKHSYLEDPSVPRFYRIEFTNGSLVDLCDMHRIAGVRARDLRPGIAVAGFAVRSCSTYGGVKRSFDLLTEDAGYRIQGVPVNSMIEEMVHAAQYGTTPRR